VPKFKEEGIHVNKSQSAIFKRLVKICVQFILACTILFLVDPSLNLKKTRIGI